jgi:hypothetical protein
VCKLKTALQIRLYLTRRVSNIATCYGEQWPLGAVCNAFSSGCLPDTYELLAKNRRAG